MATDKFHISWSFYTRVSSPVVSTNEEEREDKSESEEEVEEELLERLEHQKWSNRVNSRVNLRKAIPPWMSREIPRRQLIGMSNGVYQSNSSLRYRIAKMRSFYLL